MTQGKKQGKSSRKIGRNARRPAATRRKMRRPELFRKARNVLKSGGMKALLAWADYRASRDDIATTIKVRKARDEAIRANAL